MNSFLCWCVLSFLIPLLDTSSELEGDFVCHHLENRSTEVITTYLKTNKIIVTNWCTNVKTLFRCKKNKIVSKVDTKSQIVNKKVLVDDCCDGYVRSGTICIPFCQPTCLHGRCIGPDLCRCYSGYKGSNCNEECQNGLNCQEPCNCTNGNNCDISSGICKTKTTIALCGDHGKYNLINLECDCFPGWEGSRCDDCAKGLWGSNCNTTCDCASIECDRETGSCICEPGYYGPRCSCAKDWCFNGNCNSSNGDCDCFQEWSGINCTIPNEANNTQNQLDESNSIQNQLYETNSNKNEAKLHESKSNFQNGINANNLIIYTTIPLAAVLGVIILRVYIWKIRSKRTANGIQSEEIPLKIIRNKLNLPDEFTGEPGYLVPKNREDNEHIYEEIK